MLLFLGNGILLPASHADEIAIIFPEVREPYLTMFSSVADGVSQEFGQNINKLILPGSSQAEDTSQWLIDNSISDVVVLGNKAISHQKNSTLNTVAGAYILPPGTLEFSGITLNPDSRFLFTELKRLKPEITSIHAVYEENKNQWVIDAATESAKSLGITLHAYPVSSMSEAASQYQKVQRRLNNKTEALWLPLNGPSRDKSILQRILDTAWSRDQIVISSNLSDSARGALLSVQIDFTGLGRELGKLLKQHKDKPETKPQTLFANTLLKSINVRAAAHVGIQLKREELDEFEFIYPPQ
ncbi:hypothetical protein NBRC116493_24540 [Aurantivibrio infirmus]